MSNPDILFRGIPRTPTRSYTADIIRVMKPARVVIPCAGSFSLAWAAREAGLDPARLFCGDISLYSTALAAAMPNGEVDQIYLASKEIYDQWMNALKAVRDDLEIAAVPTALAAMARLAMERLEQITANADL